MNRKHIVVLSGAGISAESGIRTFRDADGLWEGHDVMEVASPHGWHRNPALVLDFYNQRRRQLLEVEPNPAHTGIAQLEEIYEVSVITQNVDDLHERGGSTQVLHLHGELLKVRSTRDPSRVMEWRQDLNEGDLCPLGSQLRPHIVWFGEEVPLLGQAARICSRADILVIIGTSLQVYPAAGLMAYAPPGIPVYYIDKKPAVNHELSRLSNLRVWAESASEGVAKLIQELY